MGQQQPADRRRAWRRRRRRRRRWPGWLTARLEPAGLVALSAGFAAVTALGAGSPNSSTGCSTAKAWLVSANRATEAPR